LKSLRGNLQVFLEVLTYEILAETADGDASFGKRGQLKMQNQR
jgi:hypothetical protein